MPVEIDATKRRKEGAQDFNQNFNKMFDPKKPEKSHSLLANIKERARFLADKMPKRLSNVSLSSIKFNPFGKTKKSQKVEEERSWTKKAEQEDLRRIDQAKNAGVDTSAAKTSNGIEQAVQAKKSAEVSKEPQLAPTPKPEIKPALTKEEKARQKKLGKIIKKVVDPIYDDAKKELKQMLVEELEGNTKPAEPQPSASSEEVRNDTVESAYQEQQASELSITSTTSDPASGTGGIMENASMDHAGLSSTGLGDTLSPDSLHSGALDNVTGQLDGVVGGDLASTTAAAASQVVVPLATKAAGVLAESVVDKLIEIVEEPEDELEEVEEEADENEENNENEDAAEEDEAEDEAAEDDEENEKEDAAKNDENVEDEKTAEDKKKESAKEAEEAEANKKAKEQAEADEDDDVEAKKSEEKAADAKRENKSQNKNVKPQKSSEQANGLAEKLKVLASAIMKRMTNDKDKDKTENEEKKNTESKKKENENKNDDVQKAAKKNQQGKSIASFEAYPPSWMNNAQNPNPYVKSSANNTKKVGRFDTDDNGNAYSSPSPAMSMRR